MRKMFAFFKLAFSGKFGKIWVVLKNRLAKIRHDLSFKHIMHEGHEYAHWGYFGGVFIEGHGFYSFMGGVLLFFALFAFFVEGVEIE